MKEILHALLAFLSGIWGVDIGYKLHKETPQFKIKFLGFHVSPTIKIKNVGKKVVHNLFIIAEGNTGRKYDSHAFKNITFSPNDEEEIPLYPVENLHRDDKFDEFLKSVIAYSTIATFNGVEHYETVFEGYSLTPFLDLKERDLKLVSIKKVKSRPMPGEKEAKEWKEILKKATSEEVKDSQ